MREYKIYNNTPSTVWEDSYPVGNGRMGATVMGFVDEEVLYLNEETVWSSQGKGIPNPNMADKLTEIRNLFVEGREAEGDKLAKEIFGDCHSRIRSYESAGKLKISLHDNEKCKNYTRIIQMTFKLAFILHLFIPIGIISLFSLNLGTSKLNV